MRINLSMAVLAAAACALAGCNSYQLRYEAQPEPANAHLYADDTLLQGAVGISVDTDGRRLEDIYVRKADGTIVRPVNIAYPVFGRGAAIGPGIGLGTGPVGVGIGAGIPIGPKSAHGLTTATFTSDALGPPPWELHVKVHGIEAATVPGVGGPATAK